LLKKGSKTEHILEWQNPWAEHTEAKFSLISNEEELRDTVRKDEEHDAHGDIFFICAHDWSLKGVMDEFPKDLGDWKEKGWKESTRWKFLEDFEAVLA
jgi:hypothetical protein